MKAFTQTEQQLITEQQSQGTVFRTMFFVLYINNFSKKMKSKKDLQFSGDACIMTCSRTNQCLFANKTAVFFKKGINL